MPTRYQFLCLLFALFAMPQLAHADTEKPIFVAPSGTDSGDCQDFAAPCRTIAYALDRVGKSGQIRVAEGAYTISDFDDVFHVVSGSIDIRGGYSESDRFRTTTESASTLVGIPPEYRDIMQKRGFNVLVDRKGIDREMAVQTEDMLAVHQSLQSSMSAAVCQGGTVNGLPCDSVDLLSHVGFSDVSGRPGGGADVWGFVDLNTNREYALMGYNIGTAVFDVTDATNPREVGFLDGQNTAWRDIKVYQYWNATEGRWNAYAYITTDQATDGLFVIDLSDLPHSIQRVAFNGDFSTAHNVYATNTDFGTGLSLTGEVPTLIIAGSNNGAGAYRSYTLANPAAPSFLVKPGSGGADYMHDAASMLITDARKDTQCAVPGPYCEVLFDFNELSFDTWDVTRPASPVLLNRKNYSNVAYTHSGWWSEDKQFVFVHDELDERNFALNTTLRVFSVSDLLAPVLAGTWTGPTRAIDHNGFVRGNRYYMSNYSRGLTILDITNPQSPAQVGRLDTYPATDGNSFVGAWGTYPFFHSGNIAISDIDSGFYMAADRSLDVVQGSFSFSDDAYGAAEGDQLTINVQRNGGSSGNVSVAYELVPATASAADFTGTTGLLNWANGDATDKVITIALPVDGDSEALERGLLRLVAPTGGATLSGNTVANVFVGDAGQTSSIEFSDSAISIAERGFATAVAVFRRSGSAVGAASVEYVSGAGDAAAGIDYQGATSGTINWDDGDANPKWIEFAIVDDGTGEAPEFFELSLSNAVGTGIGSQSTLRINILDGTGINSAPNAVAGTNQTVSGGANVTLNGTQSNDPDGDSLTYLWSAVNQSAGTVMLNNANTATASFTAPSVTSDTLMTFQLAVADPLGQTDTATTSVTVSKPGGGGGNGGSGGGALGLVLFAMLGALAITRRALIRKDAAE